MWSEGLKGTKVIATSDSVKLGVRSLINGKLKMDTTLFSGGGSQFLICNANLRNAGRGLKE